MMMMMMIDDVGYCTQDSFRLNHFLLTDIFFYEALAGSSLVMCKSKQKQTTM